MSRLLVSESIRILFVATLWLVLVCFVFGASQAPPPPQAPPVREDCCDDPFRKDSYEWHVTPRGQYALMRNSVQIGNYLPGDGYYPIQGDGWGQRTVAPVAFPLPAARSPALMQIAPPALNCGPRG